VIMLMESIATSSGLQALLLIVPSEPQKIHQIHDPHASYISVLHTKARVVMECKQAPQRMGISPCANNKKNKEMEEGVMLRFRVSADLVVDRRQHPLQEQSDDPTMPTKFFLAAWVGGGNDALSLHEIAADGSSGVELRIWEGDVDTVKLGVSFNVRSVSGGRNCHLASSYVPIEHITRLLAQAGDGGRVVLVDNFEQGNRALLSLENDGTDLMMLAGLKLRESALRRMNEISQEVQSIGTKLHDRLQTLRVTPANAGTQYVDAFTYCHMQGMLSHYALLGHVFRSMPSPVGLEWVMYAAYQTVQSTALHPRALQRMPDHELVARYGTNLVSRPTACELTVPYSPDVTIGRGGRANKPSEDIQRSLCGIQMRAQGERETYRWKETPACANACGCSGGQMQALAEALQRQGEETMPDRISMTICADDCENLAQVAMRFGDALRELYVKHGNNPQRLASAMHEEAKSNQLFTGFTTEHHMTMAPVLLRLGRMLHEGKWTLDLGVVSAKGPSCDLNAQAPELCGHGTVISRHEREGVMVHAPNEGTTYLTVDAALEEGLADRLQVRLTNGDEQEFTLAEFQTVLAQNMHELVGLGMRPRILAHLADQYADPRKECPFYVSMFYSGLRENNNSLGCIPVENTGSATFGAPVMGLSNPTTMAMPVQINPELERLITAQADEAWSPAADQKTLRMISSFWQPVRPPHKNHLREDAGRFIRAECTWGFDDPAHTATAVSLYKDLADRFNALQMKDRIDDGARLSAFGQFLSATLRWTMDAPRQGGRFDLTTMRNLKQAVAESPDLNALLRAAPHKERQIGERARVESDHHFYMCQEKLCMVHSHRVKLA